MGRYIHLSHIFPQKKVFRFGRFGPVPGGEGVLHYGVRRGCAPVLGSFWPENSGIGIYFYLKISVIGVYCHMEFSGIGVYCYTQNSGNGC